MKSALIDTSGLPLSTIGSNSIVCDNSADKILEKEELMKFKPTKNFL